MFDRAKWTGTRQQRIDLGIYLGLDSHEDAHITLRELTVGEGIQLKSKMEVEDRYDELKKLLPSLIVEHDFYDDGKLMENSKVASIICDSFSMLNCVAEMYWTFSFFILRTPTKKG